MLMIINVVFLCACISIHINIINLKRERDGGRGDTYIYIMVRWWVQKQNENLAHAYIIKKMREREKKR
jgi:hypothetical protein